MGAEDGDLPDQRFSNVLNTMLEGDYITQSQAQRLKEMYEQSHEMVVAAWEVRRFYECHCIFLLDSHAPIFLLGFPA